MKESLGQCGIEAAQLTNSSFLNTVLLTTIGEK